MLVKQLWVGNSLRNFNYLIVCTETGDALAIDPSDSEQCLEMARANGWTIRKVLNTHEHDDHISGNAAVVRATGAKILAHANATQSIPEVDYGLSGGDIVRVGTEVELECLDTPGHTMSHLCLLAHADTPALFCGDTLFNAGVGNCSHGGDPNVLYETFATQIRDLEDETLVFPGHDYLENNLRFTLDREPGNAEAASMLAELPKKGARPSIITNMGVERTINTFLRLGSPSVRAGLQSRGDVSCEREVFLRLREARNDW